MSLIAPVFFISGCVPVLGKDPFWMHLVFVAFSSHEILLWIYKSLSSGPKKMNTEKKIHTLVAEFPCSLGFLWERLSRRWLGNTVQSPLRSNGWWHSTKRFWLMWLWIYKSTGVHCSLVVNSRLQRISLYFFFSEVITMWPTAGVF